MQQNHHAIRVVAIGYRPYWRRCLLEGNTGMHSKHLKTGMTRRSLTIAGAVTLVASSRAGGLAAGETTPTSGEGDIVTAEVLLTGLADPRFVVVDGTDVYFTEAGSAGDEPVYLAAGDGTPEATEPASFAGPTGKISRLAADGSVTEIANDLMSFSFGASGEVNGPAGLALDGEGSVYVAMSTGPSITDTPRLGEEGMLLKIDIESGERTAVADLIDWEITHNPDPMEVFSNPYGMCLLDSVAYVADAAGNTIIAVGTATGEMSTFAITGGLDVDFFPETGNPARDGAQQIDSVPSSVQPGPDGRLYVTYITGGPFPPGLAPVDAFQPDGTRERVADGLTMSGDIAFDSAGRMYISVVSTDMINGGPGQIVRVEDDGSHTVVIDGLEMPAGIAFDADDHLYVINKSTMVSGGGELVRYSGVTDVPASN